MPRAPYVVTSLLGALTLGCLVNTTNPGDDTQAAATSTTLTTSGNQSGSVTSAPGSATDGGSDSAPTTATSTTTGPDSTGNPWTGWTCGFLECMDMPIIENECDQWAQDCPDGQKCAAVITDGGAAWNGWKCVDVTGTDEPGDPCITADVVSGADSCVKGAMCWGVDMNGMGYCVALCTGSADAPVCENKASCTIAADAALILCIPPCDPLLQDCPSPNNGCYPIDDTFTCASGDAGQANDPCEFINVCAKGLMCAEPALVGMGCPPDSQGCCTPFCKFPDGACPNQDQQCVQYFDPMQLPADDPYLNIGFCGVPG